MIENRQTTVIIYLTSVAFSVGEHVELAKRYGALVLAVEHRFYGSSINQDGGLEMDQLQYLSSQQAYVQHSVETNYRTGLSW